jgi:hypothetical protein
VQIIFETLDLLVLGDGNFCGSKMVSAVKDNLLTFPLEIDCIQKLIYFKTAQHKQKYKK